MDKPGKFETSNELKREFHLLFDNWSKRERLGIEDLAERCGVSTQYLSHVSRYGRIPSKPILTLIALNLDAEDPARLFRAARIKESWPYETGIGLRKKSDADNSLLSVKLDMSGFASAIQQIVRAELQPKKLGDYLRGRKLKIGLNRQQFFMFDPSDLNGGFFNEYISALGSALECEIETTDLPHTEYDVALANGSIDLYGPIYRTTKRSNQAIFLPTFFSTALSGAFRTRPAKGLEVLTSPTNLRELTERGYIIAVHNQSMAHHFLVNDLQLSSDRVIPCATADEALERIVLSGIPRPAHVIIADEPLINSFIKNGKLDAALIKWGKGVKLPSFEDSIALRSDWLSIKDTFERAVTALNNGPLLSRLNERYN